MLRAETTLGRPIVEFGSTVDKWFFTISVLSRMTVVLWVGMLLTCGWMILSGLLHFNAARAFDFPPGAFNLSLLGILLDNFGALEQSQRQLASYDPAKQTVRRLPRPRELDGAAAKLRRALAFDPTQRTANERLGRIAVVADRHLTSVGWRKRRRVMLDCYLKICRSQCPLLFSPGDHLTTPRRLSLFSRSLCF